MLLSEFERPPTRERTRFELPPINVQISCRFIATGGEAPDCPACGGYLELTQPGPDPTLLVGSCMVCERVTFVGDAGSRTPFLMLVPSRDEIARARK